MEAGIAHFGIGKFFRAHLAAYTDRCLALPDQAEWGILGIGLSGGARAEAKAAVFRISTGFTP